MKRRDNVRIKTEERWGWVRAWSSGALQTKVSLKREQWLTHSRTLETGARQLPQPNTLKVLCDCIKTLAYNKRLLNPEASYTKLCAVLE